MTAYQVSEMMGEKRPYWAQNGLLNTQMDAILDLVYFILAAKNPENGGQLIHAPMCFMNWLLRVIVFRLFIRDHWRRHKDGY